MGEVLYSAQRFPALSESFFTSRSSSGVSWQQNDFNRSSFSFEPPEQLTSNEFVVDGHDDPMSVSKVAWCRPDIKIALDGNPAKGQLNIIGQIHTVYNEDTATLKKIGFCQAQVLLHLQSIAPNVVFLEGLWKDLPPANNDHNAIANYCYWLLSKCYRKDFNSEQDFFKCMKDLFSDFKPGSPFSEQQKLYLGLIGAPFIYAIINPEVQLKKTISAQDGDRLDYVQSGNLPEALREEVSFRIRERLALAEIDKHLASFPGESVAFVFGREHGMRTLPSQVPLVFGDNHPTVTITDWKKLVGILGWN